jgi:ElaB/YqjD/DUF883 family membrane-anchored ribosome-binding protein
MEPDRGVYPGVSDKPRSEGMPTPQDTGAGATAPQGAALGETVKAGFDRAGGRVKDAADKTRDTLAGYCDGGVEQVSEDIVKYVRSQPMTALLIAAGVGLFVGMLLTQGRKAESR